MPLFEPSTIIATISAIVSLVSAFVAFLALRALQRIPKQKNTLAFINDYNNDERVRAGIVVFLSVYDGKTQAKDILKHENRGDYENFLVLMNKLEILAVGLNHKIYDKKMIDDCFGYDLFTTYTQSKPLVDVIRNKDNETCTKGDKAFEKFEDLAIDIGAAHKK